MKQIGTVIRATPEFLEDARAKGEKLIADQAKNQLAHFAESEGLEIRPETFRMQRQESGFWTERHRTWWQRLLRRPVVEVYNRVIDFRASVWAEET